MSTRKYAEINILIDVNQAYRRLICVLISDLSASTLMISVLISVNQLLWKMDFKKRLFINIGVPLAICLILITALFFIGFDIAKKTEQIRELRTELFFRLHLAESLALLTKEAEQALNYTFQLERILPNSDQLVSFPRDLNMIAKQTQVDINSSLGGEEVSEKKSALRRTNFSITGRGSFENFINFLKFLETGQYIINLQTLDFARQDDNFKISLTGQVFSY